MTNPNTSSPHDNYTVGELANLLVKLGVFDQRNNVKDFHFVESIQKLIDDHANVLVKDMSRPDIEKWSSGLDMPRQKRGMYKRNAIKLFLIGVQKRVILWENRGVFPNGKDYNKANILIEMLDLLNRLEKLVQRLPV